MFVIISKYLVPLEMIDQHRPDHLRFLDLHYATGKILASGPQTPRTGGIILMRAESRQEVENILQDDPFLVHGLAEYQIYEWVPSKWASLFNDVLGEEKI